jgi:hypothetical protein
VRADAPVCGGRQGSADGVVRAAAAGRRAPNGCARGRAGLRRGRDACRRGPVGRRGAAHVRVRLTAWCGRLRRGRRAPDGCARGRAGLRRGRDACRRAPAARASSSTALSAVGVRIRSSMHADSQVRAARVEPSGDAARRSIGPSSGRDGSNPSPRWFSHRAGMVRYVLRFCGEGGIRTLGTVARTHDFQSCTFDHSVTSPEASRPRSEAKSSERSTGRRALRYLQ